MSNILVIAEAGSSHDGRLDQALRAIDVAKAAGADVVKFQFWSDADRLAARRHALDLADIYRRYQLPIDWLQPLHEHAAVHADISLMLTTYLPEDVEVVAPFVGAFKVSSFESSDVELLRAHTPYLAKGCLLFLSDGLRKATADPMPPVNRAFPMKLRERVRHLHCVSGYPTPLHELNLAAISKRGYDGLSDHTGQVITGALAVIAGAKILEVHFRLDDTSPDNPDAGPFAHSPTSLKTYIDTARVAEAALGDGVKRIQKSEEPMLRYRVVA